MPTWKCFNCGKEVEEIHEAKCPKCGKKILTKQRPQVVKEIKTD